MHVALSHWCCGRLAVYGRHNHFHDTIRPAPTHRKRRSDPQASLIILIKTLITRSNAPSSSSPTRAQHVVVMFVWIMIVINMHRIDIHFSAPAGPPTAALHDPVGHASPSGMRMTELPHAQGTQPEYLTPGARGKPQDNPRCTGRVTAPGKFHPPDALRTSCGWSRWQMGLSVLETMSMCKAV